MFEKIGNSLSRIRSLFSGDSTPQTGAPASDSATQKSAWDGGDSFDVVQGPKVKRPTGHSEPIEDEFQVVQGSKVKRPTGHSEPIEDEFQVVQGPKVKRPTGRTATGYEDDDTKLA
jgi:hypothetical protein